MASLLNRLLAALGRTARDVAVDVVSDELRARSGASTPPARKDVPAHETAPSGAQTPRGAATGSRRGPLAHGGVSVYDVASRGLPSFTYSPSTDGDADPGEVVWTWVPYEEDATRGKDRPVLVLAREGGRLVVAQLTSKDHDRDAAQEAWWDRHWFDVGTGAWDPKGRPSEMRLDRLLLVDPAAVRREGATLSRTVFARATRALRQHWG